MIKLLSLLLELTMLVGIIYIMLSFKDMEHLNIVVCMWGFMFLYEKERKREDERLNTNGETP